jgi:dienelactone hydrolase
MPLRAVTAHAISYVSGEEEMEGFVASPSLAEGESRPGILLIHDWTGLQEDARERAIQIAEELGYVCFAADVYGKGVRPSNPQECGVQAGLYRKDRSLFRQRLKDALEQLKEIPGCHPNQLAAIGYCFGGTGVLELARSGADLRGVVSFHGGLDSPTPEDGAHIRSKVLVLHGAEDPFVSQENLQAFVQEMRQWQVDWQMIQYGGAVHSFTKKEAGENAASGSAYHPQADRRSWAHMKAFFKEIFLHAEGGWSSLFDERSLTGWVQKNGTATYRVEDRCIVGKTSDGSPNSFLCSSRDYQDFELVYEVQVDEALNSGVQIRSRSLPAFNHGRVHGPQVEIASNGNAGWIYGEALGTGWLTEDREDETARGAFRNGAWNHFRILAQGNRIQTWVNDIPVADYQGDAESFKEGFIGLQVHGIARDQGPYEVRWRNLYLRALK